METNPQTRILTVLAGNLLVLGIASGIFLPRTGSDLSLWTFILPLAAAVLCFVAHFKSKLQDRVILTLIAGFLPLPGILLNMDGLHRYDVVAMLLFGFEESQPIYFWLLFTGGYSAVIIGAVLHRETLHPKWPRLIAMGGGMALLVSLMMPWYVNGDIAGIMAVFPSRLFYLDDWFRGISSILVLLTLILTAGMSIAWGFGFKKDTNYAKLILMGALGTMGIALVSLLAYSLMSPLRNYNYTNNLIWVWRVIMLLTIPTGFLIAKCVGLIGLVKLKSPVVASENSIPPLAHATLKTPVAPAGSFLLPCPCCHQPTPSLKHYHKLDFLLFIGVYVAWRRGSNVACPKCMRIDVLEVAVNNMLTANIFWPILILPWSAILMLNSTVSGHSDSILYNIQQQQRASGNAQAPQNSPPSNIVV